jgi:hypothetical protein
LIKFDPIWTDLIKSDQITILLLSRASRLMIKNL